MPWIGAKEYQDLVERVRHLCVAAGDLDPDGTEEAVPDQYLDRIDRLVRANDGVREWLVTYDGDTVVQPTPAEAAPRLTESMRQLGEGLARIGHAYQQGQQAYRDESVRLAVQGSTGDETRETVSEATRARDLAYTERARLVAVLAAVWDSWWAPDPKTPDYRVVYVKSPAGQLSWHIHQDDWHLFEHVAPARHARPTWDGHSTEEKNARLAALTQMGDLPTRAVRYPSTVASVKLFGQFSCDEGGWFVLSRDEDGYKLLRADEVSGAANPSTTFWLDRGQTATHVRLTRYRDQPGR